MKGYDIMKRILKGTILLFIFTLVMSSFKVGAVIRNIGITVTVPAIQGQVTCEKNITKETDSRQYFRTTTSKYTNTEDSALVKVQTFNQSLSKYSDYIEVPVGELVAIPDGYNTRENQTYKLNAMNSAWSIKTVRFAGIWNIDR